MAKGRNEMARAGKKAEKFSICENCHKSLYAVNRGKHWYHSDTDTMQCGGTFAKPMSQGDVKELMNALGKLGGKR